MEKCENRCSNAAVLFFMEKGGGNMFFGGFC